MISWPFDSTVTSDTEGHPIYSRAYSSDVLAAILRKYFRNGVFNDDPTGFQVVEASGMTVTVKPGHALIQGRHSYEENERILTVQAADASLDRIDSVVLRLDLSITALSIDLYVVKGTAAATPVAPELTRNSTLYELGLANLFVTRNVTTVTQERITDTRLDSERCGVVASIIGDTDTSAYYTQIAADLATFRTDREADFDAWFAQVQGILGEDEAGNLLNLINRYRAKRTTVTLPASGWTASGDAYTQTLAVALVPADCVLHAGPAEASREAYVDADVHVSAAVAGSVTFTAASVPTVSLTVNLAVSEVDAA